MEQNDFGLEEAFARARGQLEDVARRAQQNRIRAQEMKEATESIVATARSPRGDVTVRARVGGRIESLEFADSAEQLALAALARITLETIAQAQQGAMKALADRGEELFGEDSDIVAGLRADAERGYPAP